MHTESGQPAPPTFKNKPHATRVMIVEDDVIIRENYFDLLTEEGFVVNAFDNQRDAISNFEQLTPDLVLLDIGLAEDREGGFQLCAELRQRVPKLPIVFLTSRNEEHDKISGIRLGADDYLTKDISTDYLVTRLRALLRRYDTLTEGQIASLQDCSENIIAGSLRIDQKKSMAYWKTSPVDLTWTQLWITKELVSDIGQVKDYSSLMKAANLVVEPNTITAHIKTIRDRFKATDNRFNCIKTVRGIGYRWVEL